MSGCLPRRFMSLVAAVSRAPPCCRLPGIMYFRRQHRLRNLIDELPGRHVRCVCRCWLHARALDFQGSSVGEYRRGGAESCSRTVLRPRAEGTRPPGWQSTTAARCQSRYFYILRVNACMTSQFAFLSVSTCANMGYIVDAYTRQLASRLRHPFGQVSPHRLTGH